MPPATEPELPVPDEAETVDPPPEPLADDDSPLGVLDELAEPLAVP